jgi:hypothetical protein
MWTVARRAASARLSRAASSSRLPTPATALKFAGGLLVFDLMFAHIRGYDAPWAGDWKQRTSAPPWSIAPDENDPTKTCEVYFRSDPARPHRSFPVWVVRSKRTGPDGEAGFQPVEY